MRMKKFLYLAGVMLTMVMTSCDGEVSQKAFSWLQDVVDGKTMLTDEDCPNILDPNDYCWEITMTASLDGITGTEVEHQWCTGAEIVAFFEMVKVQMQEEKPGATLDVKIVKTDRAEDVCRK